MTLLETARQAEQALREELAAKTEALKAFERTDFDLQTQLNLAIEARASQAKKQAIYDRKNANADAWGKAHEELKGLYQRHFLAGQTVRRLEREGRAEVRR